MLVVPGTRRHVTVSEPQARCPLPFLGESDRLGQPHIAEGVGQQSHAAAIFDGLQLPGIAGHDDFGAVAFGVADDVGQIPGREHRRLIDQHQGTRPDRDRLARPRPAR